MESVCEYLGELEKNTHFHIIQEIRDLNLKNKV